MTNDARTTLIAIEVWQKRKDVHPLTCGGGIENSTCPGDTELVGRLVEGEARLQCPVCKRYQKYIPDVITQSFKDEMEKNKDTKMGLDIVCDGCWSNSFRLRWYGDEDYKIKCQKCDKVIKSLKLVKTSGSGASK